MRFFVRIFSLKTAIANIPKRLTRVIHKDRDYNSQIVAKIRELVFKYRFIMNPGIVYIVYIYIYIYIYMYICIYIYMYVNDILLSRTSCPRYYATPHTDYA